MAYRNRRGRGRLKRGKFGSSQEKEIQADISRMIRDGKISMVCDKISTYVTRKLSSGISAEEVAFQSESWLIREVGLDNLLNARHGGGGRKESKHNGDIAGVFAFSSKMLKRKYTV